MLMKNKLLKFLFVFVIIPIQCFAYSNKIIPGGQTIGIEVNSDGVLVVGFYKVNDKFIGRDSGFLVGDRIISVNGNIVNNINEMIDNINKSSDDISFKVFRDNRKVDLSVKKTFDSDGVLKTGLYVKDQINGVGTLTYIDPETRIFGALGHEIIENNTGRKFEIKDGKIFDARVSDIKKSRDGYAGEKNANYNKNDVSGNIDENYISGIYGKYSDNISKDNLVEIMDEDNIHTGKAFIRTVIKNQEINEYEINILNINPDSPSKNILFEIKDSTLLNEAGGIVQGMSGSPIMQDSKIIGAVNYVIVNDTSKGYGIFITKMLKDGEK